LVDAVGTRRLRRDGAAERGVCGVAPRATPAPEPRELRLAKNT
jgi:hypothetical protein